MANGTIHTARISEDKPVAALPSSATNGIVQGAGKGSVTVVGERIRTSGNIVNGTPKSRGPIYVGTLRGTPSLTTTTSTTRTATAASDVGSPGATAATAAGASPAAAAAAAAAGAGAAPASVKRKRPYRRRKDIGDGVVITLASGRRYLAKPPLPPTVKSHDVLGGRGGITNFHYGNRLFHAVMRNILKVIDLRHPAQRPSEKRILATAIVEGMVTLFQTSFWEKLVKTKNEEEYLVPVKMDHGIAVRKTMQRFRETNQESSSGEDESEMDHDVDLMLTYLFDEQFPVVGEQLRQRTSTDQRILFMPNPEKEHSLNDVIPKPVKKARRGKKRPTPNGTAPANDGEGLGGANKKARATK